MINKMIKLTLVCTTILLARSKEQEPEYCELLFDRQDYSINDLYQSRYRHLVFMYKEQIRNNKEFDFEDEKLITTLCENNADCIQIVRNKKNLKEQCL
jgi:hypothetical protein